MENPSSEQPNTSIYWPPFSRCGKQTDRLSSSSMAEESFHVGMAGDVTWPLNGLDNFTTLMTKRMMDVTRWSCKNQVDNVEGHSHVEQFECVMFTLWPSEAVARHQTRWLCFLLGNFIPTYWLVKSTFVLDSLRWLLTFSLSALFVIVATLLFYDRNQVRQ